MSQKLKIGVVGAGVFGGYHANKCAEHPRMEFVGIFDPDVKRAEEGANKHGVKAFKNYQSMLTEVEAVIIASPAVYHGPMAIEALESDVHCLIEKPIATKLNEAERIVQCAEEKQLTIQAGHQERFVVKAIGLDKIKERPLSIKSHRMGKYSNRGTDVSVTLDLMTHDLDLVLMLMGEMPSKAEGEVRIERSTCPDFSEGKLIFQGATAHLISSRLEEEFRRTMEIQYPSGQVHIDFNAKTLTHNMPFLLNADFRNDTSAKDSLGSASNAFIEAVLDGKPVPVTAKDGYNALKLALIIDGVIIDGIES